MPPVAAYITATTLALSLFGCTDSGGEPFLAAVEVACPDSVFGVGPIAAQPGDSISILNPEGTPIETAQLGELRDGLGVPLTDPAAEPASTCLLRFDTAVAADFVGFTLRGHTWTAIPTTEGRRECPVTLRVNDDGDATWYVPARCGDA